MERDSSWMAAVICSIDIVEDGAVAEADGSSCAAVVIDGGGGGQVEVGRGPDISDTRLVCGCQDREGEAATGGLRYPRGYSKAVTVHVRNCGVCGCEGGRGPCPRPSKREGISFLILA